MTQLAPALAQLGPWLWRCPADYGYFPPAGGRYIAQLSWCSVRRCVGGRGIWAPGARCVDVNQALLPVLATIIGAVAGVVAVPDLADSCIRFWWCRQSSSITTLIDILRLQSSSPERGHDRCVGNRPDCPWALDIVVGITKTVTAIIMGDRSAAGRHQADSSHRRLGGYQGVVIGAINIVSPSSRNVVNSIRSIWDAV